MPTHQKQKLKFVQLYDKSGRLVTVVAFVSSVVQMQMDSKCARSVGSEYQRYKWTTSYLLETSRREASKECSVLRRVCEACVRLVTGLKQNQTKKKD